LVLALFGGDQFFVDRRYIGTFGDPNQMSYWLLCSLIASLLVVSKPRWFNAQTALILFVVILFLAFIAGSRSTLLALGVLLIGLLIWLFNPSGRTRPKSAASQKLSPTSRHFAQPKSGPQLELPLGPVTRPLEAEGSEPGTSALRLVLMLVGLSLLLLAVIVLLYQFNGSFNVAVHDFVHRFSTQSIQLQLEIRGYMRLVEFPQYLVFGAGQGLDGRFMEPFEGRYIYEIHSSIIAPLFYYGVIGFGLLFSSFFLMARERLVGWQWFVFAAPFVYGLFTYGLRTPIFWIMLATLYSITPRSGTKTETKTETETETETETAR
jgi:hypothetical protein